MSAEDENLLLDMLIAFCIAGRRPTYVMPSWMVTVEEVAWA